MVGNGDNEILPGRQRGFDQAAECQITRRNQQFICISRLERKAAPNDA